MTSALTKSGLSPAEVGKRAREIYERDIRTQVIDAHRGEFLLLDVLSGDYEIDKSPIEASHRLMMRQPHGDFFEMRIGYKTAYAMGGRMQPDGA